MCHMSSIGLPNCINPTMVGKGKYHIPSNDEDDVFRTLDIFNEMCSIVNQSGDFQLIFTELLEKAVVLTEMERGGIYLKDSTTGNYVLTVHSNISEEFKQIHGIITLEWESLLPVIIEGKVVLVSDTSAANIPPERKKSTINEGFHSYVSIPLKSDDSVEGILMVGSSQVMEYSKFQTRMFPALGEHIGMAIKNVRLMEQLRSSQEMYSELFENAADAMYIHDLDGNFLSVNQVSADLLGIRKEEALRSNIRDFLTEEGLETSHAVLDQILIGKKFPLPPILEVVSKDGKKFFLEFNIRPMMENGKLIGVHGVARDVDKRLNAEKNMLVFTRALNLTPNGINLSDDKHNITFINEAGAKLFGYSRSELIGQPANIFYAEEDLPNLRENVIPAMEKHGYYHGLILARKKGGAVFPLEVTLTSVFGQNGETVANIGVFRERKLQKPRKSFH